LPCSSPLWPSVLASAYLGYSSAFSASLLRVSGLVVVADSCFEQPLSPHVEIRVNKTRANTLVTIFIFHSFDKAAERSGKLPGPPARTLKRGEPGCRPRSAPAVGSTWKTWPTLCPSLARMKDQ